MRVVLQRVKEASVTIEGVVKSQITEGLLILLGIENEDSEDDIQWLASKIAQMRIFSDEAGLMNRSVMDIGGEMLVVSQFTLHASTKKGNRPSFLRSAKRDIAISLYENRSVTFKYMDTPLKHCPDSFRIAEIGQSSCIIGSTMIYQNPPTI